MSQELKKYAEEQIQILAGEQQKANEYVVKAAGAIAAYQQIIAKVDADVASAAADTPTPGD